MLLIKWRKVKKAMTLVEMIVAIAVTAILAVCLSMVLSPVLKTYSVNKARAECAAYADQVLGRIANDLRCARNVLVAFDPKTKEAAKYSAPPANYITRKPKPLCSVVYSYYVLANYGDKKYYITKATHAIDSSSAYRLTYPAHLNVKEDDIWDRKVDWKKFPFQKHLDADGVDWYRYEGVSAATNGISLDSSAEGNGFYFLVRGNPDCGNLGQVIDLYLFLKKGNVKYKAPVKSVLCENLVINKLGVQRASEEGRYGNDPVDKSTSSTLGNNSCKPYYSLWFGEGIRY